MRPLPSSFAFFAALAVTCPSVASSSGSPPRFSRSCDSDLAFCAPMSSPRCFRSRPATALGEFSAPAGVAKGPRTTQIEAQTLYCGPSLDDLDTGADTSGACAPKKHLGPTVEEITAQRQQEALKRKTEVLNNWSAAQDSADSAVEAYASPISKESVGRSGAKRHLGPTLDEIVQLTSQHRKDMAYPSRSPAKIGRVLTGSGRFELTPGGPSREQVHALLNLGVTEMPATKEEAAELIRQKRDMQMAKRLGMTEMKRSSSSASSSAGGNEAPEKQHKHDDAADTDLRTANTHPQEHLGMALKGLNMITRRNKVE